MEYHGMMALFFIGFLYEQTSIKTHKETSQKNNPGSICITLQQLIDLATIR